MAEVWNIEVRYNGVHVDEKKLEGLELDVQLVGMLRDIVGEVGEEGSGGWSFVITRIC
jgi:hypothetical protein